MRSTRKLEKYLWQSDNRSLIFLPSNTSLSTNCVISNITALTASYPSLLIPSLTFIVFSTHSIQKRQRSRLFQELLEASRGWFDYTMSFLRFPPCNLTPSEANPCILSWRGPPKKYFAEQGELVIGITTDDNLETRTQNAAGRKLLLFIRQAFADHDIPYTSKNYWHCH